MSVSRKLKRQIQKNNKELVHKKVLARKMGCKSLKELDDRLKRREKNLREMEDINNG